MSCALTLHTWSLAARRLPSPPERRSEVQFVTGLMWRGDDLVLSYGISDCFAAVAVLRAAAAQLQHWEAYGIGSQAPAGGGAAESVLDTARRLLWQR